MLSKIASAGLNGTEGHIVLCEADVSNGLPQFTIIGYIGSQVREAPDRVRTAIRNSGFNMPPMRITVNLSPADIRKDSSGYDLAIAVALLSSYGYVNGLDRNYAQICKETLFIGELSLSGKLLPVNGILSIAIAAREAGYKRIMVPKENELEGAVIDNIECIGIQNLYEVMEILSGKRKMPKKAEYTFYPDNCEYERDFSDIYGQEIIKYATEIAVAGHHNILYIGPAGSGKSMIASRIPGILPDLTKEERIEISKLYSASGLLSESEPLIKYRPFRAPHHTISQHALCGGGVFPRPGEISLASGGVLFLDELAEFKSGVIDSIRQPIETKHVTVSRIQSTIDFPANFLLAAATNPCKCGYYPDRSRCSCTEQSVRSYLSRISKPLLDRIDICVETSMPTYMELKSTEKSKTSAEIRKKIEQVLDIQKERFSKWNIQYNSEMTPSMLDEFCRLNDKENDFLMSVYQKKGLSARGLHKVLKVARTIADYHGHDNIIHEDLCESISFRSIEDKYWKGGNANANIFQSRH